MPKHRKGEAMAEETIPAWKQWEIDWERFKALSPEEKRRESDRNYERWRAKDMPFYKPPYDWRREGF